jgi:NADH-quinone oxidoreductase subunit E
MMNVDLQMVRTIALEHSNDRSALISVLQDVHSQYNYLPEGSLDVIARELGVPLSSVYGVATFFRTFSFEPRGRHITSICLGTACHVRGGTPVAAEFERQLGIRPGGTTPDRQFSLETVNCLGCCAMGPVVVIDGKYHGQVGIQHVRALIEEHKGNHR